MSAIYFELQLKKKKKDEWIVGWMYEYEISIVKCSQFKWCVHSYSL